MKRFDQFRLKRRQIYDGLFGAKALFIAGIIIMPALLFNPNVILRIAQFLFFWFLAWLSGRKNNPIITITVILTIVIFNLFVPFGQILFNLGAFRVTLGALMIGLLRAVTLSGLIMLSRVTIRRDLKFPGLLGELIGESFRIFSEIMNNRQRITRKNLIGDIDTMLIELSDGDQVKGQVEGEVRDLVSPRTDAVPAAARTKPLGFVIIVLVALVSWSLWAFGHLLILVNMLR